MKEENKQFVLNIAVLHLCSQTKKVKHLFLFVKSVALCVSLLWVCWRTAVDLQNSELIFWGLEWRTLKRYEDVFLKD